MIYKYYQYPIHFHRNYILFMQRFHLGKLLFKCNAGKEKGIPVIDVFRFLFCMMFSDRSFYMQMKTGTFGERFSKNTIYRFLNNARTNWQRFTTLLSADIINGFMKPLTDEKHKDVFIVDDSLFDRSRSKKTELPARVFDHCSIKYRAGFRMLTLGWSDGNSFVPVSHCLLSAAEDKNLLCEGKACDGRSLAGRRRLQARRKATDVMVELIHSARYAGITARYVLFDSWFSAPKTMIALKNQEYLDTIAMVKKGRTKYLYNGEKLNVKEIYSRNKKRRGSSRYLLSMPVTVQKNDESIPAKFVYVRNKSKRKDWLVIVSTDTELSEEEIIRVYGKRWDIEVFFKACKSYLKLVKEYRGISYDAMNAHVAIVFSRYMMLSVAQRETRTIGHELCFCLLDEMEDITFSRSMCIIMDALMDAVMEFHITEAQLEEFTASFIQRLPKYMQEALERKEIAE
ncbi:MAG: transposase [Lachnospiraceae bacterium]|nr:transposase [Lachnospiraceae bacterium]